MITDGFKMWSLFEEVPSGATFPVRWKGFLPLTAWKLGPHTWSIPEAMVGDYITEGYSQGSVRVFSSSHTPIVIITGVPKSWTGDWKWLPLSPSRDILKELTKPIEVTLHWSLDRKQTIITQGLAAYTEVQWAVTDAA